jgi:hypothetical protein
MAKIDVNRLRRVLQWNAERRRGRLAIIALLHARVDQLCGWNITSPMIAGLRIAPQGMDHATRKFYDLNSQIEGPGFLPRILSPPGIVEKLRHPRSNAIRIPDLVNSQSPSG